MVRKAEFYQGYDVKPVGDQQTVTFRGDGLSWSAYIIIPIFFPFLMLALTAVIPFSWWPLLVVLTLALGYLIYTAFQRQSFILTPTAILKNDVEYDLERISEVLIDNPLDAAIEVTGQPSIIVGGTGVAGASMAVVGTMAHATSSAAAGASMAVSRSSAKRRYRVLIRYGGRTVVIARNLKHNRAVSIFDLLTKD